VTSTVVAIDGASLSCAAVAAVARQQAGVSVGERAVAAARAAWEAYRAVLACELIAAVRALRLQGAGPAGVLRSAYELADAALERATEDRPLDGDLAAAEDVLAGLAALAPWPC
jgi:histidine ammonia-lyase